MKIKILSFLLAISVQIFANEDYYEAVELSNIHIKIRVGGCKCSPQLNIAKSYASAINEFVRELDPTEKVFIQFNEDYCFSGNLHTSLSYGKFKNKLTPVGFPFSYPYNLGFIQTSEGINIILHQNDFKIKPLLLLIEFALKNKKSLTYNERIFRGNQEKSHMDWITDSLYNGNLSSTYKKYLNRRIMYVDTPEALNNKNVKMYLQNDSIIFNSDNKDVLSIATIYMIKTERINNDNILFNTNSLFVFNKNYSFYFLDRNLKSNNKQYNINYQMSCIDDVEIEYLQQTSNYKLSITSRVFENMDPKYRVFFSEKDGITQNAKIPIKKK